MHDQQKYATQTEVEEWKSLPEEGTTIYITVDDMVAGCHRLVKDLEITMTHPDYPEDKILATYSGETFEGVPEGLGMFTTEY